MVNRAVSSKPTHRAGIGAVLALVVACGAGSSTGAGESGGSSGSNTGVASSCPCSGGLVCAVGACWEPCGPGGACKSGFVCLKDQACVMLEGYPLPDGEVVRKGLAGTFTTYQVSGDWLFLVGDLRPGAAGLYAAKLGSGAEPELRATLPVTDPFAEGQQSLPNVVTYGNKVYYADGTGHAFVSAVEPLRRPGRSRLHDASRASRGSSGAAGTGGAGPTGGAPCSPIDQTPRRVV